MTKILMRLTTFLILLVGILAVVSIVTENPIIGLLTLANLILFIKLEDFIRGELKQKLKEKGK